MHVAGFMIQMTLAVSAGAYPMPDDWVLAHAEAEFRKGLELRGTSPEAGRHFRLAWAEYSELRRRGLNGAEVCGNAGNAALLTGDLPAAILAYRQGLRAAPGNQTLLSNLAFAREQVAYAENGAIARPAAAQVASRVRVSLVGLLAAVTLWVGACLSITRWIMTRDRRPLNIGLCLLVAAVCFVVVLLFDRRRAIEETAHPVVVVAQDDLVLRKGNGTSYPPRVSTPLNRGVEMRLVFKRGDWLQVELGSGEIGWVPAAAVLVDDS